MPHEDTFHEVSKQSQRQTEGTWSCFSTVNVVAPTLVSQHSPQLRSHGGAERLPQHRIPVCCIQCACCPCFLSMNAVCKQHIDPLKVRVQGGRGLPSLASPSIANTLWAADWESWYSMQCRKEKRRREMKLLCSKIPCKVCFYLLGHNDLRDYQNGIIGQA